MRSVASLRAATASARAFAAVLGPPPFSGGVTSAFAALASAATARRSAALICASTFARSASCPRRSSALLRRSSSVTLSSASRRASSELRSPSSKCQRSSSFLADASLSAIAFSAAARRSSSAATRRISSAIAGADTFSSRATRPRSRSTLSSRRWSPCSSVRMASCAFLRAQIALPSGRRYLTASTIEPDGCSGIGGSASVGSDGVAPVSIAANAPASLPTRDGGEWRQRLGHLVRRQPRRSRRRRPATGGACVGPVFGNSDGLVGTPMAGVVGRAHRSAASAAPAAPRSAHARRRRARPDGVREVGRSSTMVAGACTLVCASSSLELGVAAWRAWRRPAASAAWWCASRCRRRAPEARCPGSPGPGYRAACRSAPIGVERRRVTSWVSSPSA